MIRVLAIDPGSRKCGTAAFEGDRCISTGTYSPHGLFRLLEVMDPATTIVLESYAVYPWATQGFNTLGVVQAIGIIKYISWKRKIKVVTQQPSIKRSAQAHAARIGHVLVGKNIHERDAELHGVWFLREGAR